MWRRSDWLENLKKGDPVALHFKDAVSLRYCGVWNVARVTKNQINLEGGYKIDRHTGMQIGTERTGYYIRKPLKQQICETERHALEMAVLDRIAPHGYPDLSRLSTKTLKAMLNDLQ